LEKSHKGGHPQERKGKKSRKDTHASYDQASSLTQKKSGETDTCQNGEKKGHHVGTKATTKKKKNQRRTGGHNGQPSGPGKKKKPPQALLKYGEEYRHVLNL